MTSTWQPISLKVVQALDGEPSAVALSSKLAEELALPRGGYVLVRGKIGRSMICVVSVNDGLDSSKIGLSGPELENLKVQIGSMVTLAPTGSLARARTVTVHPLAETVEGVTEDLWATYLGPYFQGIPPVTVGTTFLVRRGRRPVEFAILDILSSQGESLHHGIASVDTQVKCMEPLRRGEILDPEDVGFHDVGGCKEAVARIRELVEVPLRHPQLFKELGALPPRAVLVQGPPGSGKSLIARAAAREAEAGLVRLHGAATLVAYLRSTKDGEAEMREAFKKARQSSPSVLLFEKLDIIAPECSDTNIETKYLIVAHLFQLLKEIREAVIVMGTSSQDVGATLRQCGGFDSEVFLAHPSEDGRREILEAKTRNLKLASDVRLGGVAAVTQGFSGAELELLCKKAAWACAMRTVAGGKQQVLLSNIAAATVNQGDFQRALSELGGSAAMGEEVQPVEQGGRRPPRMGKMKNLAYFGAQSSVDPRQQQQVVEEDSSQNDQGGRHGPPRLGKMKAMAYYGAQNKVDPRQQQFMEEDYSDDDQGGRRGPPCTHRMRNMAYFGVQGNKDSRQQQITEEYHSSGNEQGSRRGPPRTGKMKNMAYFGVQSSVDPRQRAEEDSAANATPEGNY